MTPDAVALTIRQLPTDRRIDVEELAAILEDRGATREEADRAALADYQREQARGQRELFSEAL